MGFASKPPAWRMAPWVTSFCMHNAPDLAREAPRGNGPLDAPPSAFTMDSWKIVMSKTAPAAMRTGPLGAPQMVQNPSPVISGDPALSATQPHDDARSIITDLIAADSDTSGFVGTSAQFREMVARSRDAARKTATLISALPASAYERDAQRTAHELLGNFLGATDKGDFCSRTAGALALAHLYTMQRSAAPALRRALEAPDVIARAGSAFIGTLHAIYLHRAEAQEEYRVLARIFIPALRIVWPMIDGEQTELRNLTRVALQEIAKDTDFLDSADTARAALLEFFPHSSALRTTKQS